MSEYRDFKYKHIKDQQWQIQYPSGFKSMVSAANEDAMKALIDEIIASVG